VLLLNKAFGVEAITRAVVVGIACSITGVALIVFGSGGGFGISGTHLTGTLLLASWRNIWPPAGGWRWLRPPRGGHHPRSGALLADVAR
jgi:hypothetical protein